MQLTKSLSLIALSIFLVACSKSDNPTYTISKSGDYYTDRSYDVIHVYGFGNNLLLADEITKFLNRSEKNKYKFYQNK